MTCRRKHTDPLLGDHIPPGILMHVVFQVGGTIRGRGRGPITAAVDVVGDQFWRGTIDAQSIYGGRLCATHCWDPQHNKPSCGQ